jgi:hypothetical protein
MILKTNVFSLLVAGLWVFHDSGGVQNEPAEHLYPLNGWSFRSKIHMLIISTIGMYIKFALNKKDDSFNMQ